MLGKEFPHAATFLQARLPPFIPHCQTPSPSVPLVGDLGLQELGTNRLVAEVGRRTAVRGEKTKRKNS